MRPRTPLAPALPLALALALASTGLTGCGYDLLGTWQIAAISVDDQRVSDAGFLVINNNGDVSAGTPSVVLLRHWYDLTDGAFVPDPTPDVIDVSTDFLAWERGDEAVLGVDFPVGPEPEDMVPIFIPTDDPRGGEMIMVADDFAGGEMTWRLVR